MNAAVQILIQLQESFPLLLTCVRSLYFRTGRGNKTDVIAKYIKLLRSIIRMGSNEISLGLSEHKTALLNMFMLNMMPN